MNDNERSRIEAQIRQASDQKTLDGGLGHAYAPLRASYEALAGDPSELGQTWRAMAAYRLAHLEMRRGERTEADQLFGVAAGLVKLGPWPRLYRLALLPGKGAGPEQKREAFHRALRAASVAPAEDPRLAGDLFDLFELAAYFLGVDPTELDRSTLHRRTSPVDHRVVTNDPQSAKVPLTRAVAEAELAARATDNPNALCFRLLRVEAQAAWRPPGRDWGPVDHRWLRLIAATGSRLASDRDKLRNLVDGRETVGASDDYLRKIRERIRRALAADPWPGDPFTLALPVVGVVHWRTLEERPEPPVTRPSRPPGDGAPTGGPDDPPE